jgi:outer membrane protein assembly factor BamB
MSGFVINEWPPVWQVMLDGGVGKIVNPLAAGRLIFAGCNGIVYRFEAGKPPVQNDLKGGGYQEVRLAFDDNLAVGTNGLVWNLDRTALSQNGDPIRVQPSSEDLFPTVTSVAIDFTAGQIVAGCNGRAFGVYAGRSAPEWTAELKGLGSLEARLALLPVMGGRRGDANGVFVGTNGFVADVSYTWPHTVEQSPQIYELPNDSGGCVVNILPIADGLRSFYAGCNGYVYRLNPSCSMIIPTSYPTNELEGLGYFEVRLAPLPNTDDLVVGTNGSVLRLNGNTLETRWETSIGDKDGKPVSVIASAAGIFAGCDGKLFFLDNAGNLLRKGSLPLPPLPKVVPGTLPGAAPTTDTRLALTPEGDVVVGCAGFLGRYTP